MKLKPSALEDAGRRRDVTKHVPELRSVGAMGLRTPHGESYVTQNDSYPNNWSKTPPPRPSREGTPSLDLDDTLDLLQGTRTRVNLDRDVISTERAVGVNTARAALGRFPSNASSISAKPSRMPSPIPVVTNSLRSIHAEPLKPQDLPLVDTNVSHVRSAKDPSPLSTSSSKSSSRFGLFTKRTRSPLDTATIENAEKAAKKGPAAGTGHEGYGKYARRGRSGSISTNASRGRSTSTNSAARTPISRKSSFTSRDGHEMDEFLRERLAPVVMTGGARATDSRLVHHPTSSGESAAALTSNESGSATGAQFSSQMPKHRETSRREAANIHHLRRDHRRLPDRKVNLEHRSEQQKEGDVDPSYGEPTLVAPRSVHRLQFGKDLEPMKPPASVDPRAIAASSDRNKHDDLQSNLVRTDSTLQYNDDIRERHEREWVKSQRPERLARSRSPRKWAFFQRAQASPRKPVEDFAPPLSDFQSSVPELPATVSSLPESRSVPFYALLDSSEQEDPNQMDATQTAERHPFDAIESEMSDSLRAQAIFLQRDHRISTLLPSPPSLAAEFPKTQGSTAPGVVLRPPETASAASSEVKSAPLAEPKKPRLQQVGRIPRVVSKRDRPHKPPPQSFSRPFARRPIVINESLATAQGIRDQEIRAQGHVERPLLESQTEVIPSNAWGDQDSANPVSAPVKPNESFYESSKGEFLAFSPRNGSEVAGSSSSGSSSLVGTTAIVPEPGTAPDEDEVWNEYNEFLDTVESPAPLAEEPKDPIETNLRKKGWAPEPLHIQKISSGPDSSSSIEKKTSAAYPGVSAPTRPLPNPPDRSMLYDSRPPAASVTISNSLGGHGDGNRSYVITRRLSLSSGSRYSTSSIESDPDSLAGRENQKKTVTPSVVADTHSGPIVLSSLRFDALMTSRWLSFDRVLFSPALVEAKSDHPSRVLVIDGLGNDDWSFYCAETYVDVDVFNLSPNPASSPQNGALQLPKNYRQVQHVDLRKRFPFENGFFTAAIFRFPAAMSENAYLNSISECMRVLCPGGYLEMSILDINMVNMGNRARRALHELKYRMRVSQPDVALKSLSATLQKMVKQSGFENLNRCVVSVPVAGHVSRPRSRSGSLDEDSGTLGELRKEISSKEDGGLGKSLATVGRWWFTRCYEMMTLPFGDLERSIWNDEALLEECERKDTGFKLLLCYAQKPAEPDSRPGPTSKTTEDVRFGPL